jgi:hypothetical protein
MLIVALLLIVTPSPVTGAGPACTIGEGAGINGVQVGSSVDLALSVTGAPAGQRTRDKEVVYDLRAPWSQMVVAYGIVRRVSTRAPECRTARGTGPGSTLAQVKAAHAGANASSMSPADDAQLLTYPFDGVAYVIRGERVDQVDVFRREVLTQTVPPPPPAAAPGASPAATTAAGTWRILEVNARVDGTTLIVTGAVENRSRAQTAYVAVRAIGEDDRTVGQADTPLRPNPVPFEGTATFEIQVPVQDVPRRFAVVVHPTSQPNVTLAEYAGELKDLAALAGTVAQQLRVVVQSTTPVPNPRSLVVVVTNNSPVTVASVNVAVQISATCRVAPPTGPPRIIQDQWTGAVTLQQIGPGGSAQAPLQPAGGVCLEFTSWTAATRVEDVKVATK